MSVLPTAAFAVVLWELPFSIAQGSTHENFAQCQINCNERSPCPSPCKQCNNSRNCRSCKLPPKEIDCWPERTLSFETSEFCGKKCIYCCQKVNSTGLRCITSENGFIRDHYSECWLSHTSTSFNGDDDENESESEKRDVRLPVLGIGLIFIMIILITAYREYIRRRHRHSDGVEMSEVPTTHFPHVLPVSAPTSSNQREVVLVHGPDGDVEVGVKDKETDLTINSP